MPRQEYLNSQTGALEVELSGRKWLRDLEDDGIIALGPADDRLEESYLEIPVDDGSGWRSKCKVIRRKSPQTDRRRTLVVMFHCGSLRHGSPEMYTTPACEFALEFDVVVVVVSVEYRLAPEYPWPTGVQDAWNVCAYPTAATASANETIFGQSSPAIDTTGFITAGASAGGNIASAVLSMSIQSLGNTQPERRPLNMSIKGIFLRIPFLVVDELVPAEFHDQYTLRHLESNGVSFNHDMMQYYRPEVRSPMFSPLNLDDRTLSNWPRTYVQVGECDIFRDDSVILASVLRKNGVETWLDSHPGLAHVAWTVYTTGPEFAIDSPLGRNAMSAMKWLLHRK